jgi:hypothetical protein
MTNDDKMAALSLAVKQQDRDSGRNLGGLKLNRQNGDEVFGVQAAALLCARNGSLIWDRRCPVNGIGTFNTIYEYAAAEVYAEGGTVRSRVHAAQEYGEQMRSGFNTLSRWLLEQWGIVLFRCKESASGSGNHITTITVHADLVVNELTGETAEQVQRKRDVDGLTGQANAAYARLARMGAPDVARAAIRDAVESCLQGPLPEPRRKMTFAVQSLE